MKVVLCKDSNDLGRQASMQATACIKEAIAKTGNARILLSTGASQFTFFEHFVKEDIWIFFLKFRKHVLLWES